MKTIHVIGHGSLGRVTTLGHALIRQATGYRFVSRPSLGDEFPR